MNQNRMIERWEAVAQAAVIVAEEPSEQKLLGEVLDRTTEALEADLAAIYVTQPRRNRLHLVAQRNLPEDLLKEVEYLAMDSPFLAAKAASSREIQIFQGQQEVKEGSGAVKTLRERLDLHSIVAIPLRARGEVIGAIMFASKTARPFTQEDMRIAEALANLLAAGIRGVRSFEAERRLRATLQAVNEAALGIASEVSLDGIFRVLVERAREVTGATYAALGIGTDPEKPFSPWVYAGMDEKESKRVERCPPRPVGFLGVVARGGVSQRVANMNQDPRFAGWPAGHPAMRSFLGVPVQVAGRSIGNLYLTDKVAAPEFTEEDQRVVRTLAAHAALAVEHAHLLERVQSELNRILEGSPEGIILVDSETKQVQANRRIEELFEKINDPEAGVEQYWRFLRSPDSRPLERAELPSIRALNGESLRGLEAVIVRPSGEKVPLLWSEAPSRDAFGKITGAVVLFQDISAIKELERVREEWTSIVAHDLRAPITVIAGFAQTLERLPPDKHATEAERRAVHNIRAATERLNRMVSDLLDASRLESRRLALSKEPVDLARLVPEIIGRSAGLTAGHPVRLDAHGSIPIIQADPGRVEQILINLLSNAAKYSFAGSEIVVGVTPGRGKVIISVTNWGPGIAEHDASRLFTRFHRAGTALAESIPGLGLGLYIARGLVEAHGGRIWVESTLGETTTFRFALPVS